MNSNFLTELKLTEIRFITAYKCFMMNVDKLQLFMGEVYNVHSDINSLDFFVYKTNVVDKQAPRDFQKEY